MKTRSRYSLILIVLGVLLLMSAGTLEAKRPPKHPVGGGVPELRKEIAELRAAVARLQSMVNFRRARLRRGPLLDVLRRSLRGGLHLDSERL
jgi:hypothetical protein